MEPPPSTSRIRFRVWATGDFGLARALWGDPQVTALFDARGAWSDADVRARLARELERQAADGVQYWPMFDVAAGDEASGHLGCCGLHPRAGEPGVYELGFHLRSRCWGRGLATEAARAVVAHALAQVDVRALFAGHGPNNAASARVLAKLGFRRTHGELYPPTGLVHDCYRLERS